MAAKKLKSIIKWVLISLLLLPLLLILLTQLGPIQRAATNKATRWLTEKLETEVKLDDISWSGLNNLEINGFLIRDQKTDTLLAAHKLFVRFDFWKLFQNEYIIDEVNLSRALVRIDRDQNNSWNFDFIAEAFSSTPESNQESSSFSIQPNLIFLNNIRFDYSDAITESQLNAKLGDAELEVELLDLNQQNIDLRSFVLDNPDITYLSHAERLPTTDTMTVEYTFPDLGWYINVDEMQLKGGRIVYRETQKEKGPEGVFNPADLAVNNLSWNIRDLQNTDTAITASIKSFALQEKSGFALSEFQTDLQFTETKAILADFHLKTPQSKIDQSISLSYPELNALTIFSEPGTPYNPADVKVEGLFDQLVISPEDIRRFSPNGLPPEITTPILFDGILSGSLATLTLEERLSIPSLELKFNSRGLVNNFLDIDQMYLDLKVDTLMADYAKLDQVLPEGTLPQEFERWGNIDLRGRILGSLADFETENFQIYTRSGPQLEGDFQIAGLPDYKTAIYHFQLDRLDTKPEDWKAFSQDTLPGGLEDIGPLVLRGTFDGSLYTFQTNLNLETSEGSLLAITNFDFEEDYSNARYDGRIKLKQFDVSPFIQDTSIGFLNLDFNIDGEGLQLDDLDTKIQGVLSEQVYNNYQYDSLYMDGQIDSAAFVGFIRMADPNLAFDFNGSIPFSDSLPNYKFTLQLDTINLKPLGFYDRQIGMSSYIELDLQNFDIDELEGNLVMRDFWIQDSLNQFYADTILFESTVAPSGDRRLALDSKWVQLGMEGQYTLSKLPKELLDWLDQEFPINTIVFQNDSTEIEPDSTGNIAATNTNIKAYLRITEKPPLTKIFLPELKTLDRVELDLEFNKASDLWNLTTEIPEIKYGDLKIDSLSLLSVFEKEKLTNTLIASQFQSGENTIIHAPNLTAILQDDSLRMEFHSTEGADTSFWKIGGALTSSPEEIYFQINPSIKINGDQWNVNPDNQLVLSASDDWQINQLGLNKGSGSIILNGEGSGTDTTSLVNVDFNQFDISALTPFLDLPTGYLEGILEGNLKARDLQTSLNYIADLKLEKWTMDSVRIGNLSLYAAQENSQPLINLEAELQGLVNQMNVGGTYDIENKVFDVNADIGRMEMQALDPFLSGLIHDSEGHLKGQFTLKGSPDKPALNGRLQLNQVQTTIDYLNARYKIVQGDIAFTERKIDFGNFKLLDENNQPANLSGVINHRTFSDMVFDLRFQTDQFQFLNTTAADNDLFYGKLILDSDTDIQGPLESPRFFIQAKTAAGTAFHVVPLSDEQVLAQDDFIIYGAPALDSLGRDTTQIQTLLENNSGIDLKLNLEMTSDASLEIIIDPLTGDKLICKGNSNLAVDMDPDGNLSIAGNYAITEGKYFFSYEQLIKREFAILPNSRIGFNGDPLDALLDITAAYELRVPLSDLVQGQLVDESVSLAGQRADVQLQMKIGGNLSTPVLSFDIILLGNPQGAVADAARTRLQQLRNNETDLNTQVFGLLLFNSFISPSNSNLSASSAGETALLSSLSKLVTNELNRLASGLLKGVDLQLGVEAYKPGVDGPESDGVTTEVQLGVSKRFWNDRLNVKVGGNVNVGNTGQEQQALTALTGDFALEYQLTPDGNYLLRVYQRSDYDALYEGNVNRAGAGISIRKSLPNKEKKRKEKE
ncbi:MAG: hypothetical protein GYB31_07445 [Bacteroidetes bacterium]|nr:hypothetical protein [Bacteroidota bacterium]